MPMTRSIPVDFLKGSLLFSRFLGFTATVLLLQVAASTGAQGEPVGQQRGGGDGPTREGGIPRDRVEPNEGAAPEGTEEGRPRLHEGGGVEPLILPPDRPRWPRWILGVAAYDTPQGVVVTRVVPGSAAWRQRLEPGDRIVTVNGYQIGWVNDWLYPLSDELQRQANRHGEVTLLLQNVRNGQLVSRRVQLDGARERPVVRE